MTTREAEVARRRAVASELRRNRRYETANHKTVRYLVTAVTILVIAVVIFALTHK